MRTHLSKKIAILYFWVGDMLDTNLFGCKFWPDLFLCKLDRLPKGLSYENFLLTVPFSRWGGRQPTLRMNVSGREGESTYAEA